MRCDQDAVADLENIDVVHVCREGRFVGKADNLTAIAGEHARVRHDAPRKISGWSIVQAPVVRLPDSVSVHAAFDGT